MSTEPEPAEPSELPTASDGAEDAEGSSGRQTYRERKAESNALAGLAKALVEMQPHQLAEVPLPDEVREAVLVGRGFTRGPRVRQLRRVAQLLRVHDVTAIGAAAHDAGHKQRRRATRERVYEQWRERLVAEGDGTLAEFVDQHPMADPQRLRQLLRQARREPGSGKSKQALLAVLRLVREACETEVSVTRSADDGPHERQDDGPEDAGADD
jgi:ribosome-associated protein